MKIKKNTLLNLDDDDEYVVNVYYLNNNESIRPSNKHTRMFKDFIIVLLSKKITARC